MYKIKKLSLFILILLVSTGCVQIKEPNTVVTNPNTIPIAITEAIPNNQPIYEPAPTNQPIYQPIPQIQVQPIVIAEPPYIPQRTAHLQGAYGQNYKLKQFIAMMAQKHNYDQYELNGIFSTVNRDTIALDNYNVYKTAKPSSSKTTSVGSWD